ncbi:cytochrome P450, partial [Trifolium medium]|nr:cytochrome P450 [Trifolium medium]
LKVNFAKSSVIGVNVNIDLLGVAERFLHCRVGLLPLMYLGLPVGANPRNERTWKPLLDTLAKRLGD